MHFNLLSRSNASSKTLDNTVFLVLEIWIAVYSNYFVIYPLISSLLVKLKYWIAMPPWYLDLLDSRYNRHLHIVIIIIIA